MSAGIAWTLGALCVWRLTHLLWAEDGPGQTALRLRYAATRWGLGGAFDCFYCLSLWVALPVAALLVWCFDAGPGSGSLLSAATSVAPSRASSLVPWLLTGVAWFGLSGAAIVIERFNPGLQPPPAAEDGESSPPPIPAQEKSP